MKEPNLSRSEEDQLVAELRDIMIQEEVVPPAVAAAVEAVIKAEALKHTTVSWSEVSTILCLIFLIVGAVLPWSLTFALLGISLLASGLYAIGIQRVLGVEA